jgi:hypothetical protein
MYLIRKKGVRGIFKENFSESVGAIRCEKKRSRLSDGVEIG